MFFIGNLSIYSLKTYLNYKNRILLQKYYNIIFYILKLALALRD